MNAARKIIIDCDPGIDDTLALMLALKSPEFDILGITIVCGNVPVSIGVQNAHMLLERMNRLDIPIYAGEEKPLFKTYISAQDTHGCDGLGESGYTSSGEVQFHQDAPGFICDALKNEKNVSIIALGPMTNLAKAIARDPQAMEHLQEMISMGGSYKSHGNCSPVAEYNYWCDPHAAKAVYDWFADHSEKKIHMIGLDVTRQIVLTPDRLAYMMRKNPETGTFIRNITNFYMDFHWEYEGIIGCVINDPLAVAYAMNPAICSGFDAYTVIETEGICEGQSVVDAMDFWKKEPNSHILNEVEVEDFWNLFYERLNR